jgi:hypothetical protein
MPESANLAAEGRYSVPMKALARPACWFLGSVLAWAASTNGQSTLPVVQVTSDNTPITKSCIIEIPQDAVITDVDGNGVIHIVKPDIRVVFQQASELWGGPRPTSDNLGSWDTYSGVGIRINGVKGVTIRNASIHGFKVAMWATNADDLRIENADLSDNYRQRLRSTPASEYSGDWLYPHHNDKDEWATQHGAAIYLRGCNWPTIFGVKVRRGQNGILLHSVRDGLIYDNDCSFLSGWGLGMFRTTGCSVSRNAFDFCVRGHSEGIYNRGQDSAGILMFEQCSNNVIVQNSCTHGGDGIFGFAGLEAINGEGAPEGFDFKRKGCNDNLFSGNDLSYAAAHGLEMTFSFGNKIVSNRFVENAICGIWGGYSQDTLILRNEFAGNGGMAYGQERGAINIEHGSGNTIIGNEFTNNRCAVHLWWDAHDPFESKTWGKANYRGVRDNVIVGNTIAIDSRQPFGNMHPDRPLVALHLRDHESTPFVTGTVFARNVLTIEPSVGVERLLPQNTEVAADWDGQTPQVPEVKPSGENRPVGARHRLRGRDKIIMGEWGPWDHESPMLRLRSTSGDAHTYEVFGTKGDLEVTIDGPMTVVADVKHEQVAGEAAVIRLTPAQDRNGVFPYSMIAHTGHTHIPFRGVIVSAAWQLTAFQWDDAADPRKDIEAFRALAKGDNAFSVMASGIDFEYGNGGPRNQPWAGPIKELAPGPDRFGMIARTRLTLGKGSWRFTTMSDDGVRVLVDGKPVIENWTWHAPTSDSGVLELQEAREVEVVVEHFEIDGYSVLKLDIAPAE